MEPIDVILLFSVYVAAHYLCTLSFPTRTAAVKKSPSKTPPPPVYHHPVATSSSGTGGSIHVSEALYQTNPLPEYKEREIVDQGKANLQRSIDHQARLNAAMSLHLNENNNCVAVADIYDILTSSSIPSESY